MLEFRESRLISQDIVVSADRTYDFVVTVHSNNQANNSPKVNLKAWAKSGTGKISVAVSKNKDKRAI